MAFVVYGFLQFTMIKDCYIFSSNAVLAILTLGLYPLVWITSGGSHGTAPYFYIFNFMIIGVLLNKSRIAPMLILNIATFFGLMILELLRPEWVIPYGSVAARWIDFTIFFFIMCIAAFVLSYRLMKEYNKKIASLHKAHEELRLLSTTDTLSGLFNRRFVMSVLEKGIEEKREGGMALIMIDIDHFKGINDTYGHTVGDEVIVKISGVLQDSVRKTDILGRIGGEEFMVVLNDVDQETACAIAEDLREKVMNIAWIRVREQVTISSGLYMVKESDSLNDALEAVDTRLYQAKDEGRNRVAV